MSELTETVAALARIAGEHTTHFRAAMLEVVQVAKREVQSAGAEVADGLTKMEPVIEGWLTRVERAAELQALAVLVQVETLGPVGSAVPLVAKLEEALKGRGVL